jgi:hypothetical protein
MESPKQCHANKYRNIVALYTLKLVRGPIKGTLQTVHFGLVRGLQMSLLLGDWCA